MATITLRQANVFASPNAIVKGSPLTNAEVDNNFANINVTLSSLANNISVTTTGRVDVTANIVPLTSNTYDLGSSSNVFRDLWLSGNSLHLGPLVVSVKNGNVALDGTEVLSATGGATPADGTITTAKLAAGAVIESKIGTGAVTTAKLANTTGSGNVVLASSPTLTTPTITSAALGDGSVSTPSINFTNDTNTGIYSVGADNLGFVTGGSLRANVNSNGYFEATFKDRSINLGNTNSAVTIDCKLATMFRAVLSANTTITLANAEVGTNLVLELVNDGVAGRSVALSGGTFKYPFGAVGRSTAAGAIDIWYFTTFDGGSNWYVALPIKSAATA